MLVEAGADVDKANDVSATPLSVAAQQGNEAVVRVLIEAGADVNHADVHGVTALFIATYNGTSLRCGFSRKPARTWTRRKVTP